MMFFVLGSILVVTLLTACHSFAFKTTKLCRHSVRGRPLRASSKQDNVSASNRLLYWNSELDDLMMDTIHNQYLKKATDNAMKGIKEEVYKQDKYNELTFDWTIIVSTMNRRLGCEKGEEIVSEDQCFRRWIYFLKPQYDPTAEIPQGGDDIMIESKIGTKETSKLWAYARARASTSVESRLRTLLLDTYTSSSAEMGDSLVSNPYKDTLKNAIQKLGENLIERDTEVRLILLAALAREHILLLGPPGTGKSELGKRLANVCGGTFFERLLTKYTNPEELFGPLSLSALEQDEYVRKTEGYLPTANVAFLDEIFKANSAILNSLLTILNERLFDNGNERLQVPLMAVVGASNELPESEELEALYDRFLLRKSVNAVSDQAVFDLLSGATGEIDNSMDNELNLQTNGPMLSESTVSSVSSDVSKVEIPMEVMEILKDLRTFLRDENEPPIYCSDRRLVKAARLLKVIAATNGRQVVSPLDCLLLQHVFWYTPEEQRSVADWLNKRIVPDSGLKGLNFLVSGLHERVVKESTVGYEWVKKRVGEEEKMQKAQKELLKVVSASHVSPMHAAMAELSDMADLLARTSAQFKMLAAMCRGSAGDGSAGAKSKASEDGISMQLDVSVDQNLWLDKAELSMARQELAPKAEAQANAVEDLLTCVIAMLEALKHTDSEITQNAAMNGIQNVPFKSDFSNDPLSEPRSDSSAVSPIDRIKLDEELSNLRQSFEDLWVMYQKQGISGSTKGMFETKAVEDRDYDEFFDSLERTDSAKKKYAKLKNKKRRRNTVDDDDDDY